MIIPETRALHLRRYLKLCVAIFLVVGTFHAVRIFWKLSFNIAGWEIPFYFNWIAIFITVSMLVMGIAYLRK